MFPVRCYTCNAVLAQLHPPFRSRVREGKGMGEAMDSLSVSRMCCRRMLMSHVDIVAEQVPFGNADILLDRGGVVLQRAVKGERRVGCE